MERFIKSVKKYPCLWNIDTKEYKMKECKDEAWRNVIEECDILTGMYFIISYCCTSLA